MEIENHWSIPFYTIKEMRVTFGLGFNNEN
jgi:hypothetical protein